MTALSPSSAFAAALRWPLVLAFCFGVGLLGARAWRGASEPGLPPGAEWLPGGERFWVEQGFIEMVPPVRLPVHRLRATPARVFLKLPPEGEITVALGPDGQARLELPHGTIADRVEYRRVEGELRVADVRGTELGPEEVFRAFRPVGPTDSGLFGYRWPRSDPEADAAVRAGFRKAMTAGWGFLGQPEPRSRAIDHFGGLLDCAGCHEPHRPERRSVTFRGVRRGTDARGFHVPASVLSERAPLESHRPVDPNFEQPFFSWRCAEGDVEGRGGSTRLQCADGEVPVGTFDVAAALAAGDAHAKDVCAGRQALAERMDTAARRAFRAALDACVIKM